MPGDDPNPAPPASRLTWTYPQRRVLLVLLSILCVSLIVRYALNPAYVADPQPPVPSRAAELADKIDPNTADWQMLAALPGIGEHRAKDIVAYRERVRAGDPGRVVFHVPGDLLYVKGVGPAMVSALEEFLLFPPSTAPATRRSATAPGL